MLQCDSGNKMHAKGRQHIFSSLSLLKRKKTETFIQGFVLWVFFFFQQKKILNEKETLFSIFFCIEFPVNHMAVPAEANGIHIMEINMELEQELYQLIPYCLAQVSRQNSYYLYHLKTYYPELLKLSNSKLIQGAKLSQGHLILE